MTELTTAARFPTTTAITLLVLTMCLWLIATTGGHQLFVKEILGAAYDSQAEHFLRGDVDVDAEAIGWEAMIVHGHTRMYFGPFPAFLRIPLNWLYPAGRGAWSRLSGFLAGTIALSAFAGLVAESSYKSRLPLRARRWLLSACLVGFVFASPLLVLIGSLSIYNEAIIWGFAWSMAALFFLVRCNGSSATNTTLCLFGFSMCAGAALLSRATFGVPFLLIAPLLGYRTAGEHTLRRLAALFVPIGIAFAFYLALSYARFGNFRGVGFEHYVNPTHREFIEQHGIFNLRRVPFNFADYFSLRFPPVQREPPFLQAQRHFFPETELSALPFSETYLTVPWCSSWLVFGAICGCVSLAGGIRRHWFDAAVATALLVEALIILGHSSLAQRYATDLYPFLIFSLTLFLRNGGRSIHRALIVGLVVASAAVNWFATAAWLSGDGPAETRIFWSAAAGMERPAE